MDWLTNASYDWSMVAFGNHCSIIAHILYLSHPTSSDSIAQGPIRPEFIPVSVA